VNWEEPRLVEINMSAEIGAYQEEFEEREDAPPFFAFSESTRKDHACTDAASIPA
jgi:hypothetical protein